MAKFDEFKAKLRPGQTYRRADLAAWSRAVDRHLKQALQAGALTKLAGGLYYAPKQTVFGKAPPDDDTLVSTFLKGGGVPAGLAQRLQCARGRHDPATQQDRGL